MGDRTRIIEPRGWPSITPGMVFSFRKDIGHHGDSNPIFYDCSSVWLVVAALRVSNAFSLYNHDECYLLLGSDRRLVTHRGELGWITRIVDDVYEQRLKSLREEAQALDNADMLRDAAMALGA